MGGSKSKRACNQTCKQSVNHHLIIANEFDDFSCYGLGEPGYLNARCNDAPLYCGPCGSNALHSEYVPAQTGCYTPVSVQGGYMAQRNSWSYPDTLHNGYVSQPVAYASVAPQTGYRPQVPTVTYASAPPQNGYVSQVPTVTYASANQVPTQVLSYGSSTLNHPSEAVSYGSVSSHQNAYASHALSQAVSYGSDSYTLGYDNQTHYYVPSVSGNKNSSAYYQSFNYEQPKYQDASVLNTNGGVSVNTYPSYLSRQIRPNYARIQPNAPKSQVAEDNLIKPSSLTTQSAQVKPYRSIIKKSKSKSSIPNNANTINARNLSYAC